MIIQQTPYAVAGLVGNYATLGWLVLSLLFAVDPYYKDKLEALKKVRELLQV